MKKLFEGKGGISAQIVADSVSDVNGQRITTIELVYHRFIHGELMTHRMFSRNAMSSRAIPVERMINLVESSPAVPIHWGAKQAGMQATEECNNPIQVGFDIRADVPYMSSREGAWRLALGDATSHARNFNKAGYHKQVVNRLLEPFQMMKTLVTFTESDNFFHLRDHADAEPHIQELARVMKQAMQDSEPEVLQAGQWHLPYVEIISGHHSGEREYAIYNEDTKQHTMLTLEEALKVSASCSAQISYRRNDQSLEKALDIYTKLVDSEPCHSSAFEHAATPIGKYEYEFSNINANTTKHINSAEKAYTWQKGVTHCDKQGNLWSGNFKGFVQYRQLIPNNVYNGETNG